MNLASERQPASPPWPAGSPPINSDAATAWLTRFDEPLQGRGFYRSITGNRADAGCLCYSYAIDDVADRPEVVRRLCLDRNGYSTIAYGLGALKHQPECGRRGCGGDVAAVVTLAVDLDLKGTGLTKEAALDQALATSAARGLPITVIVDSGRGLHLYFMFRAPWLMATDDDRLAYSERQRFLAAEFGGDHIFDLARVLRLPGTWNLKDPASPLRCHVVYQDYGARIDPGQVQRLPKPATTRTACARLVPASGGSQADLPGRLSEAEAEKLMARLKRLAVADASLRIVVSPTLCCESQSHQDFATLCTLVRLGLTDRESLHVARRMRETREGEMTSKNARDDYWSTTLTETHNRLD